MTTPAADAARAAALTLALDLGQNLPVEVEAALAALDAAEQRPGQYDPLAIASLGMGVASLIVSIAQLAWTIYTDHRTHTPQPSLDSITRQVRITLRDRDIPLPESASRITEVVVTELIRRASPPP